MQYEFIINDEFRNSRENEKLQDFCKRIAEDVYLDNVEREQPFDDVDVESGHIHMGVDTVAQINGGLVDVENLIKSHIEENYESNYGDLYLTEEEDRGGQND
jgi:hypothetical protein